MRLCEENNWIKPSVYQGPYNLVSRGIETELIPCLRHFKIPFYAYSPLGGGFLSNRYEENGVAEAGSRMDKENNGVFSMVYFNEANWKAQQLIKAAADKNSLGMTEVALRWLSHHSALKKEHGDTVIIGCTKSALCLP